MPVNKNALLRYRIIDACLTNPMRKFPSMPEIMEKIEEHGDDSISESMFAKDIQNMKKIYNAPIKYDKTHEGYCYTEPGFSIKEFPLNHQEIEALDFSTALLGLLKGTKLFRNMKMPSIRLLKDTGSVRSLVSRRNNLYKLKSL